MKILKILNNDLSIFNSSNRIARMNTIKHGEYGKQRVQSEEEKCLSQYIIYKTIGPSTRIMR